MKYKKRIIIGILLIIVILIGSYLFENTIKNQGLNSAKIIKITENNKVIAYVDGEILKKLAENSPQEESVYTGPTLISTMNATGASEFKSLEIVGQGEKASTVLNRDEINENLFLFILSDGTVNLSKGNDKLNFIAEKITEIKVKN